MLALSSRALAADPEPAAADAPVSVRWSFVRLSGAESCPDAQRIAAGVRSRLGRDPFTDEAARNIEGSVNRDGQLWRAHLSVIGPDGVVLGSRDLQSDEPDCSVLADAVTLAVALVIDPRAAFAPPAAKPAPAITAEKPLPIAPASPTPPARVEHPVAAQPPVTLAPAPAQAAVPGPSASLRGLLVLGLLPRPAFGIESGGELGLSRRWSLAVGLTYIPEARTSDADFAFGLSAGLLGACVAAAQTPATRLTLCGEAELGAMHAVVYSVRPLPPGDHLWAGARLGPRLGLLLGDGLWLEAGAQALAPLLRHRFVLKGQQDPVFQSSALTFAATLALRASIR